MNRVKQRGPPLRSEALRIVSSVVVLVIIALISRITDIGIIELAVSYCIIKLSFELASKASRFKGSVTEDS